MARPTGRPGSETEVVGRRIGATLVDSVVVFFVLYLGIVYVGGSGIANLAGWEPFTVFGFFLWFVFGVLGFAPLLVLHGYSPVWFLLGFGLWAAYATAFEAAFGRTPGKALFGLVVADADGSRASPGAVAVRNLLRFVDGVLVYVVGFAVLALTERRQRLGDLAAGTVVLRRER